MSFLPLNPSPFSMVANVIIPEIEKFLDLTDGMNFSRVDRRVYACTKFPTQALTVSGIFFNKVFAAIPRHFPYLKTLTLIGVQYPDQLVAPGGSGAITHLEIQGAHNFPTTIPNRVVSCIGPLTSFKMSRMYGHQQLSLGERFSDAAKANMRTLTSLDYARANISLEGILETVQGLTTLTFVNLSDQTLHDDVFTELVANPELATLDLRFAKGNLNHGILSLCHSLRTFTPDKSITEENLIRILGANPEIENLNLSYCSEVIFTDRLFKTIAMKCSKLKKLDLPFSLKNSTLTDKGFIYFTENCKEISSLRLGDLAPISSAGLSIGIRNCEKLVSLSFQDRELDDRLLQAVAAKTSLVALSLRFSTGNYSAESMKGLSALINLQFLNVELCRYISNETVTLFLDHFPRLNTLRANNWEGFMTDELLQTIRMKLENGNTKLKFFSVLESGLNLHLIQGVCGLNTNSDTSWAY